jgi:hypothetical protein
MDALIAFSLIGLALFVMAGLSATVGVDSRDGFADDRLRNPFR